MIYCDCDKKFGPLLLQGAMIDDDEKNDLRSEKGEVLLRGVLTLRFASLAQPLRFWRPAFSNDLPMVWQFVAILFRMRSRVHQHASTTHCISGSSEELEERERGIFGRHCYVDAICSMAAVLFDG